MPLTMVARDLLNKTVEIGVLDMAATSYVNDATGPTSHFTHYVAKAPALADLNKGKQHGVVNNWGRMNVRPSTAGMTRDGARLY